MTTHDALSAPTQPLEVSALGLGCMGMSEFYGTGDEQTGIDTIHRALDLGVTFLDTADMYGPFTNEQLVGKAIAGRRDEVQLATKFGNERNPDGSWVRVNGTPDYVRAACDASLAAPRRRPPRPLLPAPRRHHRPDRGDRRRDEGARRGGQGPAPRAVGGGRRHDPPRPRRAPDHRTPERVVAVHPRPRGRDPADRPRARHRPGAVLPARPRHAHRRHHARVAERRRLARHRLLPALRRRRPRRQPPARRRGQARSPRPRAAPRASSPSPGCSPRATTSPRSPAPSGSPTSRRTSARSTSS